jgi:hypothetical protein
MDGFGSRSGDSFYDNAHQWKSWSPFYIGNKLYLNVISQDDGPTYYLFQSGLIMSPNNGGLWCNKAHYTKGGQAGPNSCDATNGKANGDPPQDDAGMQWPAGSDGSTAQKMGKLVLVQVCQANTINCPAIPGIDNSYVYFIGGSNTGTYLHRVPKTADPMLAASWTHYNNGSWDADPQNSTNIPNAPATGIAWISDMKLFVGWSWDAGGTMPVWTSPDLVNWSPVNPITNTFNGAFAAPILAAKRYSNSNPPHVIIPVVTDDRATYSIVIQDVDLGPTTARTTVGELRIFDPFSRLREVFRESSPQ